jgi:hypothetical protein
MRKASGFCGIDAGRYASYHAVSMTITGSLSVVIAAITTASITPSPIRSGRSLQLIHSAQCNPAYRVRGLRQGRIIAVGHMHQRVRIAGLVCTLCAVVACTMRPKTDSTFLQPLLLPDVATLLLLRVAGIFKALGAGAIANPHCGSIVWAYRRNSMKLTIHRPPLD